MALKNKYQREKQQYSNDGGMTWFDVSPANYRRGRLIEEASEDCNTVEWREVTGSWFCIGNDGITRWITDTDNTECVGYDKYSVEKEQKSIDGGSTWTDTGNTRIGVLIEADSASCGYIEPQYRWVNVSDDYECDGTTKYNKEKEQVSNDGGSTWTDTGKTRRGNVVIERYSLDCNYVPLYRWTESVITCIGYDKCEQSREQVSYDDGETWTDTGKTSETLIEKNSSDCGYVPPIDYSTQYLTFESLEDDNKVYLSKGSYITQTVYVSTDNGATWVEKQAKNLNVLATLNKGEKMLIKANNAAYADSSNYSHFQITKQYIAYGNIMSLIYGDDFIGQTVLNSSYTFRNLFGDISLHTLISAENLILPATTLTSHCYDNLFFYQSNLTTAPKTLPATTLATSCYQGMFSYCSSLTTIPSILPATTLAYSCYNNMFNNCTSLTTAPALPATTLEGYCYYWMFQGCTSLIKAPELPATTLVNYCYSDMFQGCTSLNYIKAMFTTTPGTTYTDNWVKDVAANGTFVKNSAATWDVTGVNGIPDGWTVQNT